MQESASVVSAARAENQIFCPQTTCNAAFRGVEQVPVSPCASAFAVNDTRRRHWGGDFGSPVNLALKKGRHRMDFMQSWTFMILMIVILVGLIGLFLYLRNQKTED